MNFFQKLGWFKAFYFFILPLVLVGIGIASVAEGYSNEVKGIALGGGIVYAVTLAAVYFNRDTK